MHVIDKTLEPGVRTTILDGLIPGRIFKLKLTDSEVWMQLEGTLGDLSVRRTNDDVEYLIVNICTGAYKWISRRTWVIPMKAEATITFNCTD